MQNGGYDSRIEQDIARCNQDIAKVAGQGDISSQSQKPKSAYHTMPAFKDILKNKAEQSHSPVQIAGEKEFISKMVEKISRPQQQDLSSQIPSLNLGQQILAQQRKIAALKRKSPGQEIKPQPPQIKSMLAAPASPQQKIIADIVAKEIMALASAR